MVIPLDITLKNWAASLVIDFPDDNVPLLYNENNWRTWGNFLVQENSFSSNFAPMTEGFRDWKHWAQAVFYTMANF
jgi:hypothetical protein